MGDDLLPTQVYHPAEFHRPASTQLGDIRYEIFGELLAQGLAPQGQKVNSFGNAHLVDRGVTNWAVTTLRLVSHRWLGVGTGNIRQSG